MMHAAAAIATTAEMQLTEGMKATTGPPVEAPTTVLALAGIPTATVWSPTTHVFWGNSRKTCLKGRKFIKRHKKE
jgi:hypothetical protein